MGSQHLQSPHLADNSSDRFRLDSDRPHAAGSIVAQTSKGKRSAVRLVTASLIVIAALIGCFFLFWLLATPRSISDTKIDFVQDYLIGKAILDGRSPYEPLSTLALEVGNPALTSTPSPHAPPFAVFCALLALLSYNTAAIAWLCMNVCLLALSVYVLFRPKPLVLVTVTMALIAWRPIHADLAIGQLMITVLAFASTAFALLRSGREACAGMALGLSLCVKPILWPIGIYFLLRKQFSAALSMALTALVANLIAAGVIGFGETVSYYTKVGPAVARVYRSDPLNFSVWSIGYRLFSGTRGIFDNKVFTPPLFDAPHLAGIASIILVLVALVLTVGVALKSNSHARSFAILMCAAIVLSPTSWWFYLGLLLIPFSTLWRDRSPLVLGLLTIGLTVPYTQTAWSLAPLAYLTLITLYLALARTSTSRPAAY